MKKKPKEPTDFERASPADFPKLDQRWYDGKQKEFESLGFSFLENILETSIPFTYQRVLVNDDRTCIATVGQIRLPKMIHRAIASVISLPTKLVHLETVFVDGSIVITDNAKGFDPLIRPDTYSLEHLGNEIPLGELLRTHDGRCLQQAEDKKTQPRKAFESSTALLHYRVEQEVKIHRFKHESQDP